MALINFNQISVTSNRNDSFKAEKPNYYFKRKESSMHRRSDETRKQFCMTVGKLSVSEKGYKIELEKDPIIVISASDRKLISDPNGEFAKQDLWRWAAGGALVIYEQNGSKFLALARRSEDAPSFGGHLTLTSGLSSSYEEFFNPTFVAIREGIEEISVVVNNQIVVLSLGPAFEEMTWDVFDKQLSRDKKFGWINVIDTPFYAHAKFIKIDEQKLKIVHGTREASHQGIICFDPKTRGIDLLKIIKVNLPHGNAVFFDCEDTKAGPLDREIFIFPIEKIKTEKKEGSGLKIFGASTMFQSGKSVPADTEKWFPCTPVLQAAIEVLLK